jgi:hypothetical protein
MNARSNSTNVGGAENLQQIVLKIENLNKKLHGTLKVAFAETVNLHNNSTNLDEL